MFASHNLLSAASTGTLQACSASELRHLLHCTISCTSQTVRVCTIFEIYPSQIAHSVEEKGAPEEGQCVHKLAEHGGQLRPPRKHGGLGGEPLGGPEPAGGPVCEGPGDAQLPHQRKYVVVLRSSTGTVVEQRKKGSHKMIPIKLCANGIVHVLFPCIAQLCFPGKQTHCFTTARLANSGKACCSRRRKFASSHTWYQKPLMPASIALPCGVRQPAESPPGLGDASIRVTL